MPHPDGGSDGWLDGRRGPRPDRRRRRPDRAAGRHRVGEPRRAGDRRRGRGGAARAAAPRRRTPARHTVVARTDLGRGERVVIAGHLDTVPLNDNLPSRNDGTHLHGLGTCDMKGGDAVDPASSPRPSPSRSATSPSCSTSARRSRASSTACGQLAAERPRAAAGRLRDPDGAVRRRRRGRLPGHDAGRGHDARRARPLARGPGRASTPSTAPAPVLERLTAYEPRMPVIDGLTYHEGLNAVGISGGVAGNVLPDRVHVSGQLPLRPRPQRGRGRGVPARRSSTGTTSGSPTARPARCPASTGRRPRRSSRRSAARSNPKFGWTDVARFSALGVPAVNFGPGDPMLAHKQEEFVPLEQIRHCERVLRGLARKADDR